MADRYFINGGVNSNWSDTGNWSTTSGGAGGSAVPLSTDAVFFDANSPNCDVNTSSRVALSLDFTGYTNTITMSQQITVSGSITLASAMTIAGGGSLLASATGTHTSNGKSWPNTLVLYGGATHTLADAWTTVNLTLNSSAGSGQQTTTINGTTLTVTGNLSLAATSSGSSPGTVEIILTGTCAISVASSTTGAIRCNLTINSSGTVTFPVNNFQFRDGVFTYIAGTVVTTGSTLVITDTATLDVAGITWNNFSITGTTTVTLTDNLNVNGLLTLGSTTFAVVINGVGKTINAAGNVTVSSTHANSISGTAKLVMTGTGTFIKTTNNNMTLPLDINAPGGTITFSGNCTFQLKGLDVIDAAGIVTDAGAWKPFWSGKSGGTFYNLIGVT